MDYKVRERRVYCECAKGMLYVFEYQTKGFLGLFKRWKPVTEGMFNSSHPTPNFQKKFSVKRKPAIEDIKTMVNSLFNSKGV